MPARPIMIAVGGDSGTGKRTLCRGLEAIFGTERIGTVVLDDYHSLDRAQRKLVGYTAADPRATNFAAMEEDLWALREGRAIEKPIYDHSDGTFRGTKPVEPREIVIVQGLFPLYTRALRSLFDVTVWMDPQDDLKPAWKMQRDTQRRGYTEADAREEMDRRAPDVARYVQPQAKYADLTVSFYRTLASTTGGDPTKLSARIRKGGRFRALDYAEFESPSTSIRRMEQTATGGFPETVIELDGEIEPSVAETLQRNLWTHIEGGARLPPAALGGIKDAGGKTQTGYALALAQLLIARRVVLIENERMEMAP